MCLFAFSVFSLDLENFPPLSAKPKTGHALKSNCKRKCNVRTKEVSIITVLSNPHFIGGKSSGPGQERTFLSPHSLEVMEVGLNQQLLFTSQAFFPLFLGCVTFATSSRKPSCTWGKCLLITPQSTFMVLSFTLSFSSANSSFMNWSTSKGFTSPLYKRLPDRSAQLYLLPKLQTCIPKCALPLTQPPSLISLFLSMAYSHPCKSSSHL